MSSVLCSRQAFYLRALCKVSPKVEEPMGQGRARGEDTKRLMNTVPPRAPLPNFVTS
jgi:hypothetical protein